MKTPIGAHWRIIRPKNVALTALSVCVAGIISNVHWSSYSIQLLLAAISAALISAAGNDFNDYCDRDLDRFQKGDRPIPSGQIAPKTVLCAVAVYFILGLVLSSLIGGEALLIASWAVILLLFYNLRWKRVPLVGNFTVAFVAALAFIYGGTAVRSAGMAFWPAWLAFLFHLGREIIKDMEDHSGDSAAEADTFVVRYGVNAGRYAGSLALLFTILSLPLPYYLGQFRIEYLLISLAGVLPVLVFVLIMQWRWSKPEQLHRLSVILKVDMVIGIGALFIGRPSPGLILP